MRSENHATFVPSIYHNKNLAILLLKYCSDDYIPILAPNFFFSSDTCQSCKEDISRTSSKSILCIPYYYYLYMYNSIFFYGSSSLVRLESVSCVLYLLKYPRRRGGGGWHCQAYHDLAPKSTHICPCDSHFRSKIQSTASPFSSLGVDVDPRGRHQGFSSGADSSTAAAMSAHNHRIFKTLLLCFTRAIHGVLDGQIIISKHFFLL